MSRVLVQWLNQEVELTKEIVDVGKDFSNGYLLGELLYRHNQLQGFEEFRNGNRVQHMIGNYCLLQSNLRKIGLDLDPDTALRMMEGDYGTCVGLLCRIKSTLEQIHCVVGKHKDEGVMQGKFKGLCNMPQRIKKSKHDEMSSSIFAKTLNARVKSQNNVDMDKHQSRFYEEKARQIEHSEMLNLQDKEEQALYLNEIRQRKIMNRKADQMSHAKSNEKDLEIWIASQKRRKFVKGMAQRAIREPKDHTPETRAMVTRELQQMELRLETDIYSTHNGYVVHDGRTNLHSEFLHGIKNQAKTELADRKKGLLHLAVQHRSQNENMLLSKLEEDKRYSTVVKLNSEYRKNQMPPTTRKRPPFVKNNDDEIWYTEREDQILHSIEIARMQSVLDYCTSISDSIFDSAMYLVDHRILATKDCVLEEQVFRNDMVEQYIWRSGNWFDDNPVDLTMGDFLNSRAKQEESDSNQVYSVQPLFSFYNKEMAKRIGMKFNFKVLDVDALVLQYMKTRNQSTSTDQLYVDVIIENLSNSIEEENESKVDNLRDMFDEWSNHKNAITLDDLTKVAHQANIEGRSDEDMATEARQACALLDRNLNGEITWEEFSEFGPELLSLAPLTQPRPTDGYILVNFPRTRHQASLLQKCLHGPDPDQLQPRHSTNRFPAAELQKIDIQKDASMLDGFFDCDYEFPKQKRDPLAPAKSITYKANKDELKEWYSNVFENCYFDMSDFESICDAILQKLEFRIRRIQHAEKMKKILNFQQQWTLPTEFLGGFKNFADDIDNETIRAEKFLQSELGVILGSLDPENVPELTTKLGLEEIDLIEALQAIEDLDTIRDAMRDLPCHEKLQVDELDENMVLKYGDIYLSKLKHELEFQKNMQYQWLDHLAQERQTFQQLAEKDIEIDLQEFFNSINNLDNDIRFDPVTKLELHHRLQDTASAIWIQVHEKRESLLAKLEDIREDSWLQQFIDAYRRSLMQLVQAEDLKHKILLKLAPESKLDTTRIEAMIEAMPFEKHIQVHWDHIQETIQNRTQDELLALAAFLKHSVHAIENANEIKMGEIKGPCFNILK